MHPESRPAAPLPPYAALVLEVVRQVPPGRVLTYGDVAEYLGSGGPRQVGAVLARYGGGLPWWRVLRAGGWPPLDKEDRALTAYRCEGTALMPDGRRVDLRRARWDGRSGGSGCRTGVMGSTGEHTSG